ALELRRNVDASTDLVREAQAAQRQERGDDDREHELHVRLALILPIWSALRCECSRLTSGLKSISEVARVGNDKHHRDVPKFLEPTERAPSASGAGRETAKTCTHR